MIVISLVNAPTQLRGYLTRFLSEVQAGLFVGKVSARVRDLLWERANNDLSYNNGRAVIAYDMDNEQGYVIKYLGGGREVVDLDGLQVIGVSKSNEKKHVKTEDVSKKEVKHWSNAYWRRR